MASTISISADRKSVKRGESVNISWTSSLPDSLVLVIEDGDSKQRVQVADSGTRVCWSTRATKDMTFTLIATTGTRKETASVKVKVDGSRKQTRSNTAGIGKFQLFKEKMQARLCVLRAQFLSMWASTKTWQKVLYAAMWALPFILLILTLIK